MLHLGCEIEFISDSKPQDIGFAIHDEYYRDMYEINSFHATGETVVDLVHQLRDHIKAVMGALAPYNVQFEHAQQIAGGYGFTGIHLHIQDEDHIPTLACEGYNKARALSKETVGRIAVNRGLSLRQLLSHHIWGGRVNSEHYEWKNSSRYNPVLYNTRLQTYEIRCIDFDMLLPAYQRKLINVLKSAFNIIADKKRVTSSAVYDAIVGNIDLDRSHIVDNVHNLMQQVEGTHQLKGWMFSPHEDNEAYVYRSHRVAEHRLKGWRLYRDRRSVAWSIYEPDNSMTGNPLIFNNILHSTAAPVWREEQVTTNTTRHEEQVTTNTTRHEEQQIAHTFELLASRFGTA